MGVPMPMLKGLQPLAVKQSMTPANKIQVRNFFIARTPLREDLVTRFEHYRQLAVVDFSGLSDCKDFAGFLPRRRHKRRLGRAVLVRLRTKEQIIFATGTR
jgi:hypothetical protein